MLDIVITGDQKDDELILASIIAKLLYEQGFDVVVSSSDAIRGELASLDNTCRVMENFTISVTTTQLDKEGE